MMTEAQSDQKGKKTQPPAAPGRGDAVAVAHSTQQPLHQRSTVAHTLEGPDEDKARNHQNQTNQQSSAAYAQMPEEHHAGPSTKTSVVYIAKDGSRIPPALLQRKNNRRSDFEHGSTTNASLYEDGVELGRMSAGSHGASAPAEGGEANPPHLPTQERSAPEKPDTIPAVATCPNLLAYMAFGYGIAGLMQALGYFSAIEFACRALEVSTEKNDFRGPYAFYSSVGANAGLNTLCAAASLFWVYAQSMMIKAACRNGEKGKACLLISGLTLGVLAAIVTALPFHVLGLRLQEGSELFLKNTTDDALNATLDAAMLEMMAATTDEPKNLTDTWPYRLNEMYTDPSLTDANRETVALCQNAFVRPADATFNWLAFNSWNMFTFMLLKDAGELITNGLQFSGNLFREWSRKEFGENSVFFLKLVIYGATVGAIAGDLDALSTDKTSLLSDTQFVFLPAGLLITLIKRFEDASARKPKKSTDNVLVKIVNNLSTVLLLLSQAPLPVIGNQWITETFDDPFMQNGLEIALMGALLVLIKFSSNLGGPLARDIKALVNFLAQFAINIAKLLSCFKSVHCTIADFRQLLIASTELFSKLAHIIVYAATWPTLYAGFENIFLTVEGPLQIIFLAGIVISSYAFNTGAVLKIVEEKLTTPVFCSLINKALESGLLEWDDLNDELKDKMRSWEKNESLLGGAWTNRRRQDNDKKQDAHPGTPAASKVISFPPKPPQQKTREEEDNTLSCSQRLAMATINTTVRPGHSGDKVWAFIQSGVSLTFSTGNITLILALMSRLTREAIGIQSTNSGRDLSPYALGASALMTLATTLTALKEIPWLNCENPYHRRLLTQLAEQQQEAQNEAQNLLTNREAAAETV